MDLKDIRIFSVQAPQLKIDLEKHIRRFIPADLLFELSTVHKFQNPAFISSITGLLFRYDRKEVKVTTPSRILKEKPWGNPGRELLKKS